MYHNNNGGNDLKDKQRHYKKYLNLRTMIAESAEKFGDKTYLRYFDNDKNICDLSFADFAKKVASLATCFHSLEDTPSRIAILSENRYEWVIAYAAAISSGKVTIPLDKELQFSQLFCVLRKPTRFFTAPSLPTMSGISFHPTVISDISSALTTSKPTAINVLRHLTPAFPPEPRRSQTAILRIIFSVPIRAGCAK